MASLGAQDKRNPAPTDLADGDEAADVRVGMAGSSTIETSPAMAQYLEIKTANPDSLLWYRMGDFYELFFNDAVVASEALSIVLTKRGKHQGQDIPMCGVPIHRADEYLQRLIKQGYRVAVCEQLEDPAEAKKRGAKSVVKRDVVRLVTPGTLTEDALLDARSRNYLTAVYCETPHELGAMVGEARLALASIDISTGEFEIGELSGLDLAGELLRLAPGEVLAPDSLLADSHFARAIDYSGGKATPIPSAYFDAKSGERDLKVCLGVADLAGFGQFSRSELAATGAVLKYVDLTQKGAKPMVRPPRKAGDARLFIDAASRASLELVKASSGEKSSTLLAAMDRTVTGAGSRELQSRLASPLTDAKAIEARLDSVGYLLDHSELTNGLRTALRAAPDLARALPRLGFGRGSPRDLGAVRDALEVAAQAATLLRAPRAGLGLPSELANVRDRLGMAPDGLLDALRAALVDTPPLLRRDGGFVRDGFNADLDAARSLRDDSRKVMAEHEARYIEETGVKGLKVRHNNILGFYIEVTQLNAKPLLSLPLSDKFRHRQTMANAVRFSTVELIETEGLIASASERALSIEQDVFTDLADQIADAAASLGGVASALAELDVVAGLAELAREQDYVRPVVDQSVAFEIRGGRHPVVQQALARSGGAAFIENDCVLGRSGEELAPEAAALPDARIWLVTGPNMAGKSTFLRQNALIAVMAQMGSYVPARSAHIGVVDRLFSRVGASDDLARGRSTFMVEMVETAAILNQASARSLVILDEVGRGTATFDGLSIAWATVEYLHSVTGARALFATHYHELTALARRLDGIANVTIDVTEWQDTIVFLHKVKAGAADRSYGIQVAKLAGLPPAVVRRAKEVLNRLEKADRRARSGDDGIDDLPLFSATRPASEPEVRVLTAVDKMLAAMHPDELTPKAALEKLYELKALAETTKKTP
ncbi:DNA mismatch repair protein MutS [Hyphomicrobium methylovorum]|uniref:DNA mismatch repair protein MutS n=1 Tax=Hyphomicrobium methylovorum TaxID=84 RepID=UPI0015E6A9CE|nr:DNA mismatch repair protein MutS [Hyphomicrobium methylovorum]MBA2126363.1 DNA mismatch repair protein MutS [Hyphomicrobium methylovorum]